MTQFRTNFSSLNNLLIQDISFDSKIKMIYYLEPPLGIRGWNPNSETEPNNTLVLWVSVKKKGIPFCQKRARRYVGSWNKTLF